ncbi:MAG: hypothetical protein KJ792_00075 [Actinobacteria bacterium]|nr:hypothetical protein [Actinomycetota bacterium]MCG2800704.1 hypothetical protein [Cellulomonas sp.]
MSVLEPPLADAPDRSVRPPRTTGPRRWVALVLVVVLVVLAVAAVGSVVVGQRDYTAAADRLNVLVDQAREVESTRAEAVTTTTPASAEAAALAAVDVTGFADPGAAATLTTDVATLATALTASGAPLDVPDYAPRHPRTLWPTAVDAATTELRTRAAKLDTAIATTRTATDALTSALAAVTASRQRLLDSVATVSAQVDAANDVAANDSRFVFRDAAAAIDPASGGQASALAAYVEAGRGLQASQAAEEAELDGPLRDSKVAVEQFARSIDGGVLLDFDWAPTLVIDGQTWGRSGSLAGWTQFWFDRGGYATISLTSSVAAQWPSSKSLVVHEVGHAIQTKCPDLADHSTRQAVEAWATAWAIGMGYTDPGNGTQAYGAPPASLVEISTSCR